MQVRTLIAAVIMAATLGAGWCQEFPDMRMQKKLIECGWDTPTTDKLGEYLEQIEQAPYDGIRIKAVATDVEGKPASLSYAFYAAKWEREAFGQVIEDLKACDWQRMTDNFLATGANPGGVDWFDDEGWGEIASHMGIAAWIAKEGGLKGIVFDAESYSEYHQWMYNEQPMRAEHSFNEYYAKARERGRQVMEAIVAEYPDITVFMFFGNVVNSPSAGGADPRPALAGAQYGLYPAFIDGWLDAVPPTVKLVDACESGYRFTNMTDFLTAAQFIRGEAQSLVSPENRAKYRAQVQVGFGIYLDAHANEPDAAWYLDPGDGTPTELLGRNITNALRVSDEYVWTWGEKWRWWPGTEKSWEEALPGITETLNWARDPMGSAVERLAAMEQEGTAVSSARNGDFGSETSEEADGREVQWQEGGVPAGWHSWQGGDKEGVFTWDREVGATAPGSARAAGVGTGCFLQGGPAQPGESYFVRAKVKLQGTGTASIRVRWQSAEDKWTLERLDRVMMPAATPGDDGWQLIEGVATVPDGAANLFLLLGMGGQPSAESVVWFDDVSLVRVR